MSLPFAFDLSFNPIQMLLLGAIAVLLFGKRLPEVGKSVGKGLFELRKNLRSIEDVIQNAGNTSDVGNDYTPEKTYEHHAEDHEEATAPKFEPPPQPKRESAEVRGN